MGTWLFRLGEPLTFGMSRTELGPEKDCVGEAHYRANLSSERSLHNNKPANV
jgi:hypothetical protein